MIIRPVNLALARSAENLEAGLYRKAALRSHERHACERRASLALEARDNLADARLPESLVGPKVFPGRAHAPQHLGDCGILRNLH